MSGGVENNSLALFAFPSLTGFKYLFYSGHLVIPVMPPRRVPSQGSVVPSRAPSPGVDDDEVHIYSSFAFLLLTIIIRCLSLIPLTSSNNMSVLILW